MRTVFRIVGLLAAWVAMTPGLAAATTLTDSQIFSQFNAVIFDNFSANSEVEGRTVVGGNVTSGTNFTIKSGLNASSFGALSVYRASPTLVTSISTTGVRSPSPAATVPIST
jgi:hypothetical protein